MSETLYFRDALVQKSAAADTDARFVMSAATPDRVRDTIEPAAYVPTTKRKKLLALFNHDPDHPVGYWTNMQALADTLTGEIKLASTGLGRMLKTLLDDDVPLAASVAFLGKYTDNKAGGRHFTSMDIVECSLVAIPAHPRAQRIAKQFGIDLDLSSKSGLYVPAPVSGQKAETLARAQRALRRIADLKPQR